MKALTFLTVCVPRRTRDRRVSWPVTQETSTRCSECRYTCQVCTGTASQRSLQDRSVRAGPPVAAQHTSMGAWELPPTDLGRAVAHAPLLPAPRPLRGIRAGSTQMEDSESCGQWDFLDRPQPPQLHNSRKKAGGGPQLRTHCSQPFMAPTAAPSSPHTPMPRSQIADSRVNDHQEVFDLRAWPAGHLEEHVLRLSGALLAGWGCISARATHRLSLPQPSLGLRGPHEPEP